MKLSDICNFLEEIAPLSLQEDYDNAGLLVGDYGQEINKALICLDCTEDVMKEARKKSCDLVISHHPIIFKGIKKFNNQTYVERIVMDAIKGNVAIYAAHTNLDNVLTNGVNQKICHKLGLRNLKILKAKSTDDDQIGSGMLGNLDSAMDETDFLKMLKREMNTGCIRHTKLLGKPIEKVAVCGGSGSFLLQDAIKNEAGIFITADFKYHQFFDAENKIIIADVGHYESEQYTNELFYELLSKKFPTFAIALAESNTNPINYLV